LALGVGVGVEVGLLNIRPIFGHLLKRRKRRRTDGIMESGSFYVKIIASSETTTLKKLNPGIFSWKKIPEKIPGFSFFMFLLLSSLL
jgi:hypothetical protein